MVKLEESKGVAEQADGDSLQRLLCRLGSLVPSRYAEGKKDGQWEGCDQTCT